VASKLYVVVRGDLKPGLRAAQAVHAAIELSSNSPRGVFDWEVTDGSLVLLQTKTPSDLEELRKQVLNLKPYAYGEFHEIDLNGELTSIAFWNEEFEVLSDLVRELPLAFSELN